MQAWLPIAQEKLALLKQQQEDLKGAITDLSTMIDTISAELP
jgi:hypothetical protein